jgi:hypothetical protein
MPLNALRRGGARPRGSQGGRFIHRGAPSPFPLPQGAARGGGVCWRFCITPSIWRAQYVHGYNAPVRPETLVFRTIPFALATVFALASPLRAATDAQAQSGLQVRCAGQPPRTLSLEQIAALKLITQQAAGEHTDRSWTGPLLWDVLVDAGAVDPAKPADAVHLGVHVVGADGWIAVFGLAEPSPEFGGKPIQLADRVNGEAIPGQGLRLIVPGEHRGGRSVRNVVRIDIE